MARILLSMSLVIVGVTAMLTGVLVRAEAISSVRISLIQAAGSVVTHERIDVTNYGNTPVDMTDWRVVYRSASGASTTPLVTFRSSAASSRLMLGNGQTESMLSKELVVATPTGSFTKAWQFTGGISSAGGSIQLIDATDRVVDMVGWGAVTNRMFVQGDPAPSLSSTNWLVRKAQANNNATDFELKSQAADNLAQIGQMYEAVDACSNIPGFQQLAPDGYVAGADGTCQPLDVCINIDGLQTELPVGMEYDSAKNCVVIDSCQNIDGMQIDIPGGYELTGPRKCEPLLPVRHLIINELLPNPSGADSGNEFIELHNVDLESVQLDNYVIAIGNKQYKLPAGVVIAPGAYWTVSDSELGVSLPNTTGQTIYLVTTRGLEVASVPAYKNAPDDASWAYVDGLWQFSYAPTPGGANVALPQLPCQSGYERDEASGRCKKVPVPTLLSLCAEGQYRSETTGRCRTIATSAVLVPCKDGQYRSEETGRCRAFVSAISTSLSPCADNQFRNPLTNRCKSIASSDDTTLTDCGEGRERNPETHRCRNVVSANVPAATFAVAPVKETAKGFVGWWALGGVGVLAAGYGAWEWRRELALVLRRAGAFIGRR